MWFSLSVCLSVVSLWSVCGQSPDARLYFCSTWALLHSGVFPERSPRYTHVSKSPFTSLWSNFVSQVSASIQSESVDDVPDPRTPKHKPERDSFKRLIQKTKRSKRLLWTFLRTQDFHRWEEQVLHFTDTWPEPVRIWSVLDEGHDLFVYSLVPLHIRLGSSSHIKNQKPLGLCSFSLGLGRVRIRKLCHKPPSDWNCVIFKMHIIEASGNLSNYLFIN